MVIGHCKLLADFEVRVLIPRYDPFQVDPFQSNLILGIKWISAGIPGLLLRAAGSILIT
jgi:hypothetical protein